MPSKQLHLVIPDTLVSEPFLYHLVKIFDIVPSVRSAMVEKGCISMVLEMSCQDETEMQQGINYLTDLGISVSHIYGDVMVS